MWSLLHTWSFVFIACVHRPGNFLNLHSSVIYYGYFFLSLIFFFFSVLATLSTSLLITVNLRSWTLLRKSLSQSCLAEHRLRDCLARRRLWVAHNCQTHIFLFSLLFSLSSSLSFIRCFSLVDLSPFSL